MPRVQVQYQGRGEQPQAVMAETIQPIRARMESGGPGFELAKALGAANTEGLAQNISNVAAAQAQEDRKAAETYANSMTVDELGKRIKDGTMLPSQSPTFAAALQHIYGENTQSAFERDTLSKLSTGQLKFNSPEEMDKYLTDHRNEALSGASKYAIAGYDKGYGAFREKALNANTKLVNDQTVERGVQESSDNLATVLSQVTSPDFKGDAAQELVNRYQLLRKTSLLRDDAAKEALSGLAAQIATSGNQGLLNGFLEKKLDNGVSVRAVVGDLKAVGLTQHAEVMNDKNQKQRIDVELRPFVKKADAGELDEKELNDYVAKNERWITTSQIHALTSTNQAALEARAKEILKGRIVAAAEASVATAKNNIGTAVRLGNFAFLPQQKAVSPTTGEEKDYTDQVKTAQEIIAKDVAEQKMPVGKATEYWATNNVENPEWQKEIQAGASNVASVGWTYDGKNIGQLNPQGQKALETFMRINTSHPAYAEKLVGNPKDYKTMSDIQFLVEKGGFPNVSDAAALVNQVNRADISKPDYGNITKGVHDAVNKVVNPGWFDGTVGWWKGLFGNDQVNLTSVQSDIRRRAELLVRSGQVPDAAAAVKSTIEYMASPAVTTKINNTLYFNKDLPQAPKGSDTGELMGRFIKTVPGQLAKDQKMSGDVRLEPNQSGGFTAWLGGVPLVGKDNNVVTYQKEDISKWMDGAVKADRHFAIAHTNFKNRIEEPLRKSLVRNRGALSQQDLIFQNNILSPEGFKRVLSDGNENKSLDELRSIYRPK